MMGRADEPSSPAGSTRFATTDWSLVVAAGRDGDAEARLALATFCETYWYPLYAFIRRQGRSPADAQDLTQGLFARLIERGDLQHVTPAKGRLRSFLLAAAKHYLLNEWDRSRAEKRGGGQALLSLDIERAEGRYRQEPFHEETPERVFDRQWALTMLECVRGGLRQEAARAGKAEQFDRLQAYLTGDKPTETYARAAADLGISEAAVKMAVSRLRRKFHERLRLEIARTVQSDAEIEGEILALLEALRTT